MPNWERLATPPIDKDVFIAVSNLQMEWHFGYVNDHNFISALNVLFDAMTIEDEQ